MTKATPPLDGLLVIALEHAIAAPLCTRQLAELGARVIKIERREQGILPGITMTVFRDCVRILFGPIVQKKA